MHSPTDSPVNILRNYLFIVGAALSTSVLGALLGILLTLLFPDGVGASNPPASRDFQAAAAVGALLGLAFGTLVMMFCIVVAVLAIWFRPRNIERHFERLEQEKREQARAQGAP